MHKWQMAEQKISWLLNGITGDAHYSQGPILPGPITPKARYSQGPLLPRPHTPKAHYSEGLLLPGGNLLRMVPPQKKGGFLKFCFHSTLKVSNITLMVLGLKSHNRASSFLLTLSVIANYLIMSRRYLLLFFFIFGWPTPGHLWWWVT